MPATDPSVGRPPTTSTRPAQSDRQWSVLGSGIRSWATPGRRPVLRAAAVVVWLVVAVFVQLLRSSRIPVWDTLWAEDGRFFTGEARLHPWSTTLLEPIASYLQIVPRFAAALIAQLPVGDAALAVALFATGTTALLSVYVFVVSADVVPRLWQRCALAALVVLHPAAAYEVNAALNNLHWYLLFAAFWACVGTATSGRRLTADVAVVVLATLSDPLAALLLPLTVWRGIRSRRRWWVAGVLAGCVALQYVSAISNSAPQHGQRHLEDLPLVYAVRVAANAVLGDALSRRLYDDRHTGLLVALAVALGVVLALAAWRIGGPQRTLLIALAVYSIVFLVAELAIRGGAAGYLRRPATLPGSRYLIVPLWFLYTALIVAAGAAVRRLPSRTSEPRPGPMPAAARLAGPLRAGLVPALVLLVIGLQVVDNYAARGARTSGTSWRVVVAHGTVACRSGRVGQRVRLGLPTISEPFLLRPGLAALPVSPFGRSFWAERVRCSDLGV